MKKQIKILIMMFVLVMAFSITASAHELWIETNEVGDGEEIKVEVLWGHRGDFLDNADHENYRLFVRYPNDTVEELELERRGVQPRSFIVPTEKGEYVFWAERKPSAFTREDITTLSVQMAKNVFRFGEGNTTLEQPTDMPLEIIPLSNIDRGNFKGKVLLEGETVEGASVSVYGPGESTVMTESNAEGIFEVDIREAGSWLVKANIATEEEGEMEETAYTQVSRTTTLVFDIEQEELVTDTNSEAVATDESIINTSNSSTNMIFPGVIGLFLGVAATLVFTKKKSMRNIDK
ncbi:DUF4198 domain-containing protein [Tindallia californiensis]|uniref:Uncharacterized conserved protein, contains GH25 family domain n=1 Tax=Tindallia californiensis TaxID=159292 RepID=A0A1H3P6A3_9FIRM|nr:DUF4198 domain-containing protein [Tindallia californiensis]SDY96570.1 Uncharacterized conserved protein, contains GH25 family domain [Tindallia californiensis]